MPLQEWLITDFCPTSSQDQCPFFTIPPGLRNRMYEDLLYVPRESNCIAIVHYCESSGTPTVLRLLLTCRQVRDEAEGIFYNLDEIYFDISSIDLPNFHHFLRALSPRRRSFIKRMNLDIATVESVASVLRLRARMSSIEIITFGFPRGHDCLSEGLLMRKLKLGGYKINTAIVAMPVLQQIRVAVVGNGVRRQNPLVIAEAAKLQTLLHSLVDKKNGGGSSDWAPKLRRSLDAAALSEDDLPNEGSVQKTPLPPPSTAENWPARRFSNLYERFDDPGDLTFGRGKI